MAQQDTPKSPKQKKLKSHYFLSYSGLALTSFYVVLTVSIAIQEQHNWRTGCMISCFNGLLTIMMVAPAFILESLLGIKDFDMRNWYQLAPSIAFTALLVYLVVTGLEKLVCYLIARIRHSRT